MTNLEIPHEHERTWRYRFFEILPGTLSWTLLLAPLILSLINVALAVFFILAYILIYLTRAVAFAIRAFAGYRTMRTHTKLDWNTLVGEVEAGEVAGPAVHRPAWHYENLQRLSITPPVVKPSEIVHAIIIATYNESREVVEPTIQAVADSLYDMKKVVLILAYEERGGERVEKQSKELIAAYKHRFKHAMAVKHPRDIPGEIIGKGGNITYAGRRLQTYLEEQGIDPIRVPVTTLDADNRPDKKYLAALSYLYAVSPDPRRVAYQPLPMFTNNIWDAPAPMRVIATGNNFFYMVMTQRSHVARNFSAHAQSMQSLIDTDFWSVRTIVEDGHHFWRSYFRYDGNYRVYPLAVPIYQDAVLAEGYLKTLKAQFIQLRRWTYGASDVAYIAHMGFMRKNKVPKFDLIAKFFRLLENHVNWAAGAVLLAFAAFIPVLLHPESYVANQLPLTVRSIHTAGMVGIFISLFIALKTLPPRPARYRRHRKVYMVLQWVYLPLTTILYGSTAAFYSQTRLMLKKYLTKFDTTEKAVKK